MDRITDRPDMTSAVDRGRNASTLTNKRHHNSASEIRLFANDCVCYREIKDMKDTLKLQKDVNRLGI